MPELESSVPVAEPSPAPVESTEVTPAESTPVEPPAPTLYQTPDGRQVDAETLQREWKENFLPDYTRKAQELAELKRAPKEEPEWAKPDYVPKTYAEVIQIAKQEAIAELERGRQAEAQQRAEIASQVDAQLNELKASDPKLDENSLFLHASKYGFRDLKIAHENYRTMRDAVAQAEARAVANLQARGQTPVAMPTGTPPPVGDAIDPGISQKFGSAREYLASLRGGN
jgi:hypothetical protein